MTGRMTSRRRVYQRATRVLVVASVIFALVYLKWLLFDARPSNPLLYAMLLGAELFNVAQAMGFWYTIYRQDWIEPPDAEFGPHARDGRRIHNRLR